MEFEKTEGDFRYRKTDKGIVITGYEGREASVEIPQRIENLPVYKIGKKAFLSCKSLIEVTLCSHLEELEEWAFAYCTHLEKVWFPTKRLELGKGIFFGCGNIKEIGCWEETTIDSPWKLLGAVPILLEAEYLLTPWEAREEHWIEKWDARVFAILQTDDSEGYSKTVLCGEEDLSASLEDFIAKKRQMKAELAFIRLMNPYLLPEERREKLLCYVREHTKGCASEAAWEIVKKHGEEKEWFEIFAVTGCLTEENFEQVLEDSGKFYAEMKAYFIKYHEENMKKQDFFDSLSLDL